MTRWKDRSFVSEPIKILKKQRNYKSFFKKGELSRGALEARRETLGVRHNSVERFVGFSETWSRRAERLSGVFETHSCGPHDLRRLSIVRIRPTALDAKVSRPQPQYRCAFRSLQKSIKGRFKSKIWTYSRLPTIRARLLWLSPEHSPSYPLESPVDSVSPNLKTPTNSAQIDTLSLDVADYARATLETRGLVFRNIPSEFG